MKKMNILSLLLIGFTIIACSETGISQKEGNIRISGNLENVAGKKIIFERFAGNQPEVVDTFLVSDNGDYGLVTSADNVDFYRMLLSPSNSAILILSPDENITISGNGSDLKSGLTVEGSKNTELLWSYYKTSAEFGKKSQELRDKAGALTQEQNTEKTSIIDEFNAVNAEFLKYTQNFITENNSSPAIFSALGNLKIENDLEYYVIARDGLKESFSESNYYSSLDKQIKQFEEAKLKEKMFDPGNEVPNITQNDPTGQARSLYDLRGKIVLLDFWASWCRPCRSENPNVVRLYNKYNKDGFDIYSVSLDKTQDKWVKAIESDGLVWENHVSDLKYWNSEAAKLYSVKSIPFTVLLDREGRVIKTKLRGASLEAKLAEIFGY